MKLPKFKHQSNSSNLCAYFSIYHFLDTPNYNEKDFINDASSYYQKTLGMKKLDADKIAIDGNDPEVVASILKLKGKTTLDEKDFLNAERALIAQEVHFFTLLKDNEGNWWNYDSLQSNPTKVNNLNTFLTPYKGNLHRVFFKTLTKTF